MMSGDDFSRDEEETTVTVDIDALNTAYSSINNDIFLWFSKKKKITMKTVELSVDSVRTPYI